MARTSPWPKRGFVLSPIHHAFLGATALAVIVGAAALGVSHFGDPHAAAPRIVLSLAKASNVAAERVTVTEAAATPEQVQSEDPGFYNAVQEVGEAADDKDQGSRALPASPLPKAPIAAVSHKAPNGLLPVIAPDGRTPAQLYARPFRGDAAKPKIGLIVGGLGLNGPATEAAIEELPADVTLSFVPYAKNLQSWIDKARAQGHEVLLELPMEPFDPEANDTGPETLTAAGAPHDNITRLETLLSKAAGYFGVTNYQGARFAASGPASAPVAVALKQRGMVFFGNALGPRTALGVEATRAGLPFTSADRIIDVQQDAAKIDDQLLTLEALALQNGAALGSGFAYPVTIDQIRDWSENVASRGYVLAPASAIIEGRTARR